MAIDVKKANKTLFKKKIAKQQTQEGCKQIAKGQQKKEVKEKLQVKSELKVDREHVEVILNRNIFVDGELKKIGECVPLPYYEALRLKGISYAKLAY